jgi:hypothetical protein
MSTNQKLSAINNMQESRVGGWLNNNKLNKLNILTPILSFIDKKIIEPGGMYSRLTRHGRDILAKKHGVIFTKG